MPIYRYKHCDNEIEIYQKMGDESPFCEKCGEVMTKVINLPIRITLKNGRIPVRSKGYKDGYSKEYLKDVQTR